MAIDPVTRARARARDLGSIGVVLIWGSALAVLPMTYLLSSTQTCASASCSAFLETPSAVFVAVVLLAPLAAIGVVALSLSHYLEDSTQAQLDERASRAARRPLPAEPPDADEESGPLWDESADRSSNPPDGDPQAVSGWYRDPWDRKAWHRRYWQDGAWTGRTD